MWKLTTYTYTLILPYFDNLSCWSWLLVRFARNLVHFALVAELLTAGFLVLQSLTNRITSITIDKCC